MIVCCGGCAGKRLGGVKSGYFLLGQLGHSCTALYPCLTQIETDPTWVKALKGVRADCRVALRRGGRYPGDGGELQFTEFGVSGPVAFELSRAASTGGEGLTLVLDLFRDYPAETLAAFLRERRERFPQLPAEELFSGSLQSRLGKTVLKRAGIAMAEPLGSVGDAQIDDLCKLVKAFPLNVTGVKGFDNAQVTVGGVLVSGIRRG
ncbi:MAG: NAD(P)/FAD-dependent oxidoreductase [Oscillospiraceae bacterium]